MIFLKKVSREKTFSAFDLKDSHVCGCKQIRIMYKMP